MCTQASVSKFSPWHCGPPDLQGPGEAGLCWWEGPSLCDIDWAAPDTSLPWARNHPSMFIIIIKMCMAYSLAM